MYLLSEDMFTKEEDSQEGRFEKEGEGAFHRQRLRNDIASIDGETGPVRSELKLHGDTGHDTHDKGDGEDSGPEMPCCVIALVLAQQVQRFENHDQQSQPHGELRKEIVKGNCEGKL